MWYRPLLRPIYIPTLIAEIGVGAMYPILALSPVRMGASFTGASAVVAAYSVGRIIGSAAGGIFAAKRGSTQTAVIGLVGMSMMAFGCAGSETLFPFVVAVTAFGIAHAIFHIARQAQTAALILPVQRARALTSLAGMWRISNFAGPTIGAVVIHAHGLRWTYVLAGVVIALAAVSLIASGSWREAKHHIRSEESSATKVVRENRRVISTLGVAIALTAAVRAARLVALPLWADHLGLSDGTASAIFAVSAMVDMILFYPAGSASDRWGRRWSAVPSTLMLGLGFLCLPLSTGAGGLMLAAIIIGLGNGWGSGLLMTLGADIAPPQARSVFLGLWMLLTDIGSLAGPVLVSMGAIIGLPVGIVGVGVLGLGSTVMLLRWIPAGRVRDT